MRKDYRTTAKETIKKAGDGLLQKKTYLSRNSL